MKKQANILLLLAVFIFSSAGVFAQDVTLNLIGQYHTGIFDAGAAEISAYDPASKQLFFTNAEDNSIVVLDLSDPSYPTEVTTIDMSVYGDGVNSVAVYNGLVAVAVQADPVTDPGSVVFFKASDASHISTATVGALPDMVAFTNDGQTVVVANEGEPNDDYDVDPEGSISILDVSGIDASAGTGSAVVSTAGFNAFDAQEATLLAEGVRIFGPGATVSQDLEPEYVTISSDDATAYVVLQENNALAVVDIASATVTDIWALGFKDHSQFGNEIDASNDDGAINLAKWPVWGMYQPDAISTITMGGNDYLITVNEGDARDYDGFSEEFRIGDFRLNPSVFTDSDLQEDENLGRLRTTNTLGMNSDSLFFVMEADSAQETLGGDNRGSGEGEFKYDVAAQTMTFTMTFEGLDFNAFNGMDTLTTDDTSDDVTGLQFSNAASGADGSALFDVLGDADTQVSTDDAGVTTVTGEWSEGDATFVAILSEMEDALFEEEIPVYVNVLTVGQAGGAIRGQLIADPMFDELYSYGARSFTIWSATDGSLIYDSGSDMELRLSLLEPDNFNSTNSENDSFDNRSDDKGPEPEAVTVVYLAGKTYALIGLERIGGVMVYDVSDPTDPTYISYANPRNFNELDFNEDVIEELDDADDTEAIAAIMRSTVASGPESITFLKQGASPAGHPLALVSNEVTGSITVHEVEFASEAAPLFISEYADGDGGSNKYLELYNPTDEDVLLQDYAIARVSNDPSLPGDFESWEDFSATDTIKANSTFLWVNPSAVDSLLDLADATGNAFFNGDDAVALVFGTEDNYEVLDMFGDFLGDPGTAWDVAGIANATADRVLIRKPFIKEGNPAPQGSFGTSTLTSEWIVGEDAENDFSNAGEHMIDNSITLTILHNNDGESQLIDLGPDTLENFGGAARFRTLVEDLRDEADYPGSTSILLSSGDNFLAGPEFNAGTNDGIFYDAVTMDLLGYDAIALGNHDFDFGPEVTADFISAFANTAPTFLSANLDFNGEPSLKALEGAGRIASSTIVEAGGQMIGIIGATTPNLPFISSPGNVVVDTDVAGLVQDEIDALEAAGVNKIVLISHLQGIEEDSTLATQLSGIDILIAGGGDELLANDGDLLVPGDEEIVYGSYPITVQNLDGNNVPIVTTRGSYSYVGRLIVEFDENGDIVDVSDDSGPVRVSGIGTDAVDEDLAMLETVVEPVADFLDQLDQTVVAVSDVELDGVRNSVRGKETNLGNLISQAYLRVAQDRAPDFGVNVPEVALQNGGGIRNDNVIPAGNITELLTFDILPFGNFLSVVEDIPAEQFKEIMENAVSKINSETGEPSGSGTGRFAQAAGFYFVYDLEGEPRQFDEEGDVTFSGDRIVDLVLDDGTVIVRNGEVVEGAPKVNMAIGDFNAGGGDQYPFGDLGFTRLGITDQQAFSQYLSDSEYLDGEVSEDDFPEGGIGNITRTDTYIEDILETPEGVRVTVHGIVTRAAGAIARIQDPTAGVAVFSFSGEFRDSVETGYIRQGDLIRVTGEIDPFNGLHEVAGDLLFTVLSRNNTLPEPQLVTLAEIAANGEEYENELVVVKDITITTDDTEFEVGTSYDITDESGETEVSLRVQTSSTGESANFVGTAVPAGEFTYTGIIGQFDGSGNNNSGYQLVPSLPSDIRTVFQLAILHNNDGESQLVNAGEGLEDFGGVARFKTMVDLKRSSNQAMSRGVLMLSSGDNFLAGPEYTVGENDTVFYDALAVDEIGYDALSLGNHDFDFGPEVTADFVSQISSIFLSANLDFTENASLSALEDDDQIAAAAVFEVNGEEIGIVGAITPNLPFISSPGDVEVLDDVATIVQAAIDELEAEGVDKIILISHLQGIQEDSVLATQLSGIDIMIAGGGDELLANEGDALIPGDEGEVFASYPMYAENLDGNDVPIVTTTGSYKYLGQLVVEFDANGDATVIIDDSGIIRIAGGENEDAVESDPYLQEFVVDPVVEGLAELASNVIATSEVALDGVRSNIRARETNQGNLIADAFLWQANELADDFGAPQVQVAIANGGGIRNDNVISAGNISELTTFDMLPFLNFITIVEGVTPERFKLMMENAVSRIILDGGEPVGSGEGTGRYAQFAGFTMEYNPTLTAVELDDNLEPTVEGIRVIDITLDDGTKIIENGLVVAGAPDVNLATANFTAGGGDQYPLDDLDQTLVGVTYQQALSNYIIDGLGGSITSAQYPEGGEGRAVVTDRLPVANEPFSDLPAEFGLDQNYPNPFNPTTNIQFALPQAADVQLSVYNMLGQKVATLVNNKMDAGYHSVAFDARSLASGMYIYRIEAGKFTSVKKMMLIK